MDIRTGKDLRVRQLIEMANQAFQAGRQQQGQELLKQAEAEAPRHPLVLNETARLMILGGKPAIAYELLQQALQAEPDNPALWVNLAAALRSLDRRDEEMAAIHKVLALEPHNVRVLLQKASLQELQGHQRAAAATYRAALQKIPPNAPLPPPLRSVVQHAREAVAANNRALENFLEERIRDLRTRYADEPLERLEECVSILLQKQPVYRQQPTFMYFPQLPAIEFHDRASFPWLDSLEAATEDIRAEFLSVLADGPGALEVYSEQAHTEQVDQPPSVVVPSRGWNVYYLWREGVAFDDHLARCPRTVAALQAWPRWDVPRCGPTAVFSILNPKARIPPHTGVNNTRLIVHLPLIVPPGCVFRVGGKRREWEPGKAFVFDDTIEHEAWNDSDELRAVLILDIWNPRVLPAERELLRAITAGVAEYYGNTPHRNT